METFLPNSQHLLKCTSSYRTYEEWKLFVVIKYHCAQTSSYRTYEEWKPSMFTQFGEVGRLSSYRTYEEWKPKLLAEYEPYKVSSYRTYEEWKQEDNLSLKPIDVSSYRTYEEWKLCLSFIISFGFPRFLPYL